MMLSPRTAKKLKPVTMFIPNNANTIAKESICSKW
jgi:hypothetical protein